MHTTDKSSAGVPVKISCPGCGRHDWVTWPAGAHELVYKCFSCEKTFTLHAGSGH